MNNFKLFNGVKKTYKIYTLGCKVNQYDSGKLASELERAGLVKAVGKADLAVINTCAVTQTAMVKSGRMVRLAKKENPKAKVVVVGCAKEMTGKITKVQDTITKQILNPNLACRQAGNQTNNLIVKSERARYFIKIQDGCEQYCTYCIIPYTRGKLSSRPAREVISEVRQAVAAGYGEIVLTGIHLGLYGHSVIPASEPESRVRSDKQVSGLRVGARNDNLAGLLKKLLKIKNLGRIRLSSIEITEVTDEIIDLMKKSNKLCRHLHIPLQSGCDKVLKLMNRPYSINNYELRIKKIRKIIPDIAITTDVIVGFPGETEKDFQDTVKFIKKMKFSRLHVFPFSPHAKTPASKLPGRVSDKEKLARAFGLRKLGTELEEKYRRKFKGKTLAVVIERIKADKIIGKTQYYFDLEIERGKIGSKNIKIREIIKVKNQ